MYQSDQIDLQDHFNNELSLNDVSIVDVLPLSDTVWCSSYAVSVCTLCVLFKKKKPVFNRVEV